MPPNTLAIDQTFFLKSCYSAVLDLLIKRDQGCQEKTNNPRSIHYIYYIVYVMIYATVLAVAFNNMQHVTSYPYWMRDSPK